MPSFPSRYSATKEDVNYEVCRVTLISAVGAFTFGFDINWWGAIIAQPYFNLIFGEGILPLATGGSIPILSSTQQSLGGAVSVVGVLIGNISAGIISKTLGFRFAFAVSALKVIIGTLIQITCDVGGPRYWQLVLGKTIIAAAAGLNAVNIPLYLGNCAPPSIRGAMINSYSTVVGLAAVVASSTIYALSTTMNRTVWLIPIGIQFVTPFMTLALIAFQPENPHWLIEKGRLDQGIEILRKMRPSYTDEDLQREVDGITTAIADAKKTQNVSIKAIWKGVQLKRTLTAIGLFCLFQAQGLGFLLGYLAVLFVRLGLPNPFQILVIIYCIFFACTIASMFYQDVIGRRAALLVGASICGVAMLGFSAVLTAFPVPTGGVANACVFLVMLWFIGFTTTWYPVTPTAIVEIPSILLRPATISIASFCANLVGLLVVTLTPYIQDAGYGNLGAKIGFLYGSFSICAIIFVFLLVPELKGRSVDEIDWMYDHAIPIRSMGRFTVPTVQPHDVDSGLKNDVDDKQETELVERLEAARP